MIRNIIKSWMDYSKTSADLRSVVKPPDAENLERINKAEIALKRKLVAIHAALDAELGDSDPMDDVTDDEMREQYPGVWAAAQIADLIGPGPWDQYKERAK